MNKILILYTSIGLGHKMIARNIAAELSRFGYSCVTRDILEVEKNRLSDFGAKLYMKIISKAPWVWDFLYTNKSVHKVLLPFRDYVASKNSEKVLSLILNEKPGLVITTQVTASSVVSNLKKRGLVDCGLYVAFSDYHFHRFWKVDNADGYLVNIVEQKNRLIELGISPNDIFVCGITLPEKVDMVVEEAKEKKKVLLAAGSLGIFEPGDLIDELLKKKEISIMVVTGKNEKLKTALDNKYSSEERVEVLGFMENMDEVYRNAGIFITKPGGISVAEALSYYLPICVIFTLPGQEELNMRYLVPKGLVIDMRNKPFSEIVNLVEIELNSGKYRKGLGENNNVRVLLGKSGDLPICVNAVNSYFSGASREV